MENFNFWQLQLPLWMSILIIIIAGIFYFIKMKNLKNKLRDMTCSNKLNKKLMNQETSAGIFDMLRSHSIKNIIELEIFQRWLKERIIDFDELNRYFENAENYFGIYAKIPQPEKENWLIQQLREYIQGLDNVKLTEFYIRAVLDKNNLKANGAKLQLIEGIQKFIIDIVKKKDELRSNKEHPEITSFVRLVCEGLDNEISRDYYSSDQKIILGAEKINFKKLFRNYLIFIPPSLAWDKSAWI
jgi:hypothetical protein